MLPGVIFFFFFRFSPLVLWVGPWVFENHIFPESTLIVSLVFSVRPLCVLVPSLHACFSVPGSYGSYLAASLWICPSLFSFSETLCSSISPLHLSVSLSLTQTQFLYLCLFPLTIIVKKNPMHFLKKLNTMRIFIISRNNSLYMAFSVSKYRNSRKVDLFILTTMHCKSCKGNGSTLFWVLCLHYIQTGLHSSALSDTNPVTFHQETISLEGMPTCPFP